MNLNDKFWLKEAQRIARLGIFAYDLNKNIWNSSEILDEIFGINDDYIKDFQGWINIVHSSQKNEMISWFYESIKTRDYLNKEFKIVNQIDKTERWLKAKCKMYFDENGMPEKLVGAIQDISDLKQSEEKYKKLYIEFQQKQSFLMSLINSIPDLFFYKDIDSKYLGCNKAFEEFTGINEESFIGMTDFDVFETDIAEAFIMKDLEMIQQKKYLRFEEWIKYPNGKSILLDTIKTPFYDSEGNVLGIIGICRDITERKMKEELQRSVNEERRRLNELKEYDRIKTEFFANISHELRTPVNVIFSALQMHELKLKECSYLNASEEIHKYPKMMKQNCYRLLRLINNLIDITKIDNDYLHLNETNYEIISLVENKGLSLIFDTNIEEKIIACDPEKIERIILNLLSNAIKFTPYGGNISIKIEDNTDNISIIVKDTGRGIPIEKTNSIFERFVQVDKTFARDHEGSGIGLSLVKALVELHGGTISVVSELEKGSEFIVQIPVNVLESCEFKQNYQYNEDSKFYVDKLNIEFSDIYF